MMLLIDSVLVEIAEYASRVFNEKRIDYSLRHAKRDGAYHIYYNIRLLCYIKEFKIARILFRSD